MPYDKHQPIIAGHFDSHSDLSFLRTELESLMVHFGQDMVFLIGPPLTPWEFSVKSDAWPAYTQNRFSALRRFLRGYTDVLAASFLFSSNSKPSNGDGFSNNEMWICFYGYNLFESAILHIQFIKCLLSYLRTHKQQSMTFETLKTQNSTGSFSLWLLVLCLRAVHLCGIIWGLAAGSTGMPHCHRWWKYQSWTEEWMPQSTSEKILFLHCFAPYYALRVTIPGGRGNLRSLALLEHRFGNR